MPPKKTLVAIPNQDKANQAVASAPHAKAELPIRMPDLGDVVWFSFKPGNGLEIGAPTLTVPVTVSAFNLETSEVYGLGTFPPGVNQAGPGGQPSPVLMAPFAGLYSAFAEPGTWRPKGHPALSRSVH